MNILLNTHTFIWYFQGNKQIHLNILEKLEEPDNSLYLSIASLWEISIKMGLGKLSLEIPFHELELVLDQLLIRILPITFADTECYQALPFYHRDPFNRILIAQAINHSLPIASADKAFDNYSIQRIWA